MYMKEIFNRRSIRKFTNKPVEKEKIEKLLRAAMQAPSAANQQPWEFIVVEGEEALKELAQTSPYAKPVESSGVTFVLLADTRTYRVPSAWQQDMSAAAQNLLLEAVHLDLGGVWLGVSTSQEIADNVSKFYALPEYIVPFALLAVGYPNEQENVFVDRYVPEKIHYGAWS